MLSFRRRFPEGRVGFLAVAAALLLGCDAPQQATRAASEPSPPPRTLRLVSLSPAASQFLLALGAGSQIVGVDPRSSTLPALSDLPVVELAGVRELAPDLVLAPIATAEQPLADALRAAGHEVIAFEPHSLEEAYALCRDLGARLVGAPRATAFEVALSRELAQIASASFGKPRPRVAAVIGAAPLELVGGHSFITDFIEIAGGTSVTHGGEELRTEVATDQLAAFAPDLLLFVSPSELTQDERRAIRQALPAAYRSDFYVFDPDQFWVRAAAVAAARRLRAVIEPLSLELEQRAN